MTMKGKSRGFKLLREQVVGANL